MVRGSLITLALTSGLAFGLGCRQVPASLPEPEQPLTRAGGNTGVFVESQPQADNGRLMQPISAEAEALYSCWFEQPYDYMFRYEGEPLDVHTNSYGVMMAGISGLLYYGDLNTCAGRLVGQEPASYSDLAPLEALAGVPATLPEPSLPFAKVNPAFVAWARATLLPDPSQTVEGIPVQIGYDRVFYRFFQVMGESLFWLGETGSIDAEARTYLRDVGSTYTGIDWLENRYAAIPNHNGYADGTQMTAAMAAGFWLRRELDGSIETCWHGLREVYERYDPRWLDELRKRYPKGAAVLDQMPDPVSEAGQP